MKFNIKLTIQSIIRFEQLLGKPFSKIDYTVENDLKHLLYCLVLCNNDVNFTYDQFITLCENEKQFKDLVREFEELSKTFAQFQNKPEGQDHPSHGSNDMYIKDLAATLIVGAGIDTDFVMNKMCLYDIEMYIEAYERKKKEQIENDRLWTFLTILPHVDGKKIKAPADLYPLPWEIESIASKAANELERGVNTLDRFLNGEIKFN